VTTSREQVRIKFPYTPGLPSIYANAFLVNIDPAGQALAIHYGLFDALSSLERPSDDKDSETFTVEVLGRLTLSKVIAELLVKQLKKALSDMDPEISPGDEDVTD
jgi:hypothetical protein